MKRYYLDYIVSSLKFPLDSLIYLNYNLYQERRTDLRFMTGYQCSLDSHYNHESQWKFDTYYLTLDDSDYS